MYDQDWINDTPPPKQRKVPQHADLKARIAELEAESERRRAALNDMQDQLVAAALRIATLEAALVATFGPHRRCASCGRTPEGIAGVAHADDCPVGAALRGEGEK